MKGQVVGGEVQKGFDDPAGLAHEEAVDDAQVCEDLPAGNERCQDKNLGEEDRRLADFFLLKILPALFGECGVRHGHQALSRLN